MLVYEVSFYLWGNQDKYFSSVGSAFLGGGVCTLGGLLIDERDDEDVDLRRGNTLKEKNRKKTRNKT